MAITLSAAIGPSTNPLPIAGGPPPQNFTQLPIIAQLENEQVLINSAGPTLAYVIRGYNGTSPSSHASGTVLTPEAVGVAGYPFWGPSGFLAETMDRNLCPETSTIVATTTQIALQAIWLRAGMTVSNISFCSSTQAAVAPLHYCFALYTLAGALCATTADQTSTAWAANTLKTLAVTTPYVVPATGLYYLAFEVAVTTTVPTLKGAAVTDGALQFTTPALSGVSGTVYTTGTAVTTITGPAAKVATSFWGAVS